MTASVSVSCSKRAVTLIGLGSPGPGRVSVMASCDSQSDGTAFSVAEAFVTLSVGC